MTNDELKKKIIDIIHDTEICSVENDCDICKYGQELMNYKDMSCRTLRAADNLIAAGIGDVKDLQVQVNSLEITNIALQAGYDDAEKDRLYWVNKYKEAEHRVEVAERALDLCETAYILSLNHRATEGVSGQAIASDLGIHKFFMEQAEKELAEEKKNAE